MTGNFWSGGGQWEGKLGPWSTLKLDGLVFPGVKDASDPGACPVEITGEVRYAIDRKKIKGHDGHKLTAEGFEPTKCVATVKIYSEAQYAAFRAYLPTISPKIPRSRPKVDSKGKVVTKDVIVSTSARTNSTPQNLTDQHITTIPQVPVTKKVPVIESYRPAFAAEHPWLNDYGIGKVYINEISFPSDGDGRMIRVVKMSLWEVFDIKKGGGSVVKQSDIPDLSISEARVDLPPGTVAVEPNHP